MAPIGQKHIKINHYKKKTRDRNRSRAIHERGDACEYCSESYASDSFYDFHHKVPSEKSWDMAIYWDRGWEKIKVELAKCVMLCPSCHRIEHIKRGDLL